METLNLLLTSGEYILFSGCEIKVDISTYDTHYFYHIWKQIIIKNAVGETSREVA